MNIQRKNFKTENQKGSHKYVEEEYQVHEGILFPKPVRKKMKVPKPVPIMSRVQKFVELIGHERILNISEYRSAHERIGDDNILNITIFYWSDSPIEFNEEGVIDVCV